MITLGCFGGTTILGNTHICTVEFQECHQEMSSLGSESYQIIVFLLVEFKHLLYLLQKCFDIGHT